MLICIRSRLYYCITSCKTKKMTEIVRELKVKLGCEVFLRT